MHLPIWVWVLIFLALTLIGSFLSVNTRSQMRVVRWLLIGVGSVLLLWLLVSLVRWAWEHPMF